jgi:uncharacterized tellurite resistance protein B-like protein
LRQIGSRLLSELGPLAILATALAYVIMVDRKVRAEERAKVMALLGKHVTSGVLSRREIDELAAEAFERVAAVDTERFLRVAAPRLTYAQKLAVLANMYEAMLVDGLAMEGEATILREFIEAFGVDLPDVRAMREVLRLACDTTIFIDPLHPWNRGRFRLGAAPRRK